MTLRAAVYLMAFMIFAGAATFAQAQSCEAALQFDTVSVQQNYLAKLAVLNVVNQSNYEESKKNYAAAVPGYFSGSFDEFEKKRSTLQNSLKIDQSVQFDSNYVQRILSPAGARAFAECVAAKNAQPLVAWISSGQRSSTVAITIKRNGAGTGVVKINLSAPDYIKVMSGEFDLSSGSSKTVFVQSPLDKPFLVAINGSDPVSGADYTTPPLEMPPYVQFISRREFTDVTGTAICGAGGFGSTAANYNPTDVTLAAPTGYLLLPDTRVIKARRVIGGPGLVKDPVFIWNYQPAGATEPVAMTGHPTQCEGNSGHTQGHTAYDFQITAFRDVVSKQ